MVEEVSRADIEWIRESIVYLEERCDHLEKDGAPRFWYYGFRPFGGVRENIFPWIGSDGNMTWWRETLVIPFFGLGALIIGLKWKLIEDDPPW